tara:strand:+ start:3030 stop:3203 length:174 start_codon:yes stop_codon:yes gene_type:complete
MKCYYCGKKRETMYIKFCNKCSKSLPKSKQEELLKEKIKLGQKIRDYFNKTTEGNGK